MQIVVFGAGAGPDGRPSPRRGDAATRSPPWYATPHGTPTWGTYGWWPVT